MYVSVLSSLDKLQSYILLSSGDDMMMYDSYTIKKGKPNHRLSSLTLSPIIIMQTQQFKSCIYTNSEKFQFLVEYVFF